MSLITGYCGCSCHSFKSWNECDKAHNQKFKVGDPVKQRCLGTEGVVVEKCSSKGYYIVSFGPLASDRHLEHAANLLLISKNEQTTQLELF